MNALITVMASSATGNVVRWTVVATTILLVVGALAYFKFRDRDSR